ncbi:unnamed protein product [Ectocarpus sp. 12 AP-2014]
MPVCSAKGSRRNPIRCVHGRKNAMRAGKAERERPRGERAGFWGGRWGKSVLLREIRIICPFASFLFLWYRLKNQARNDDTEKGRRQSSGPVRKKSRPGISSKNAKTLKQASLESHLICASSLFSSRNWQGLAENVRERRTRSNQRQNKQRKETLDNNR